VLPGWAAVNSLTITEKDNTTTANYPIQIGRPFVQGEIAQFPQAVIDGSPVTTQADVKKRWPDGSVKHAILSFLIPTLSANSTVTVTFQNQASGNNTALTKTQMLDAAFDFDAVMELTNGTTVSASARTMLNGDAFTVWTSGPIATTIVLADHSAARAFDIGFDANKSFRPIFIATFWPTINKVRVRYIGEIANTEVLQDQIYSLVLKLGFNSLPTVYTKGSFTQHTGSRWTKLFWINEAPSAVAINHNLAYLSSTTFIHNYDPTKVVPESAIVSAFTSWTNAAKDLFDAGNWTKIMSSVGGRPDIGPYPNWTVRWLYSGDPRMEEKALGNADLAAAWGMHFREGASGLFFDRADTVPAIGKVLSVSARPGLFLGDNNAGIASLTLVGPVSNGGWAPDASHQPDPFSPQYILTGDYWYLEEMQFWASWGAVNSRFNPGSPFTRGPEGDSGGIDQQTRGEAWLLRNRVHAAFLSVDGSAEKSYFETLINDLVAIWEGIRNITGTSFQGNADWNWGNTVGIGRYGSLGVPQPLPFWEKGGTVFVQFPMNPAVVQEATSPWEQNFLTWSLGRAKELGYPTGPLLSWIAVSLVGQLTDLDYDPILVSAFRLPTVRLNDGMYFDTWADTEDGFLSSLDRVAQFNTNVLDTDHGFANIALAATSMVAGEPGGAQAWDFMALNVLSAPGLDDSPKWAIIPRSVVADPSPGRSDGSPTGTLPFGTTQTTLSLTTTENATCKYSTSALVTFAAMANTFQTIGGGARPTRPR